MAHDHELRRRYHAVPIDELEELVRSGQLEDAPQRLAEAVLEERRAQPEPQAQDEAEGELPPLDENNPYAPPRTLIAATVPTQPARRYYALAAAIAFGILDLVGELLLVAASTGWFRGAAWLIVVRVVMTLAAGAIAGLIFRPFEMLAPLPTRPLRGAAFFGVSTAVIFAFVNVTMLANREGWYDWGVLTALNTCAGFAVGWLVDRFAKRWPEDEPR